MPKVTSRRHKYHLAAKKRDQGDRDAPGSVKTADAAAQATPQLPVIAFNPFAGLKIDPASLNIPPPEEWDRKTVVSIHKEITKGKNKKEKAKIKKELLLKKLEATRDIVQRIKERKQREKTVITRDLQPLLDSLPSVDLIHHEASKETKGAQARAGGVSKKPKDRNSMKAKRKQKEMLKDIDVFKQVLANEHFKANPAETMLNHLTLFVQKEYQSESGATEKTN